VNGEATTIQSTEAAALASAIRSGDQAAFEALAGLRRRELLVHCYAPDVFPAFGLPPDLEDMPFEGGRGRA
jgi:hypothetical protein